MKQKSAAGDPAAGAPAAGSPAAAMECWLRSVVVAENFCPFAKREVVRGSIRYRVSLSVADTAALQDLLDEIAILNTDSDVETSLLIFAQGFSHFDDYLYLLDLAQELLTLEGYEGVYQLASFHPDYCFADSDSDDAANFTNRSPYPALHLLREKSLTAAIDAYGNISEIPTRNIARARELGAEQLLARLLACRAGRGAIYRTTHRTIHGTGIGRVIKTGRYRHYKGGEYTVIDQAIHSETMQEMVLYRPLYGEGKLWVRPLDMFLETVVVDGEAVRRFEFIGEDTE